MVKLSNAEQEFMDRKIFATVAVISPKSKLPYATTVWAHYNDGKFYIITNTGTAKYRFIRDGNNKIAINIVDPRGWPYISVNGECQLFFEEDRDDFWDIILDIIKKYNSGSMVKHWLDKMKNARDTQPRMLVELDPENFYSTVG